jgi:hypothetical protein
MEIQSPERFHFWKKNPVFPIIGNMLIKWGSSVLQRRRCAERLRQGRQRVYIYIYMRGGSFYDYYFTLKSRPDGFLAL